MTNLVTLRLAPESSMQSQREPVVSGIPFAKGTLRDVRSLKLFDQNGAIIPAHFSCTASWPDESVKWANLYFQVEQDNAHADVLYIKLSDQYDTHIRSYEQPLGICVEASGDSVTVNSGSAVFEINKDSLGPFRQVFIDGSKQLEKYGSNIGIKDRNDSALEAKVLTIDLGDESNFIQRTLTLSGVFYHANGDVFVEFLSRLTFYAGLTTVKVDFRVLNPRAALHPSGVWDLGDKGSVFFNDLTAEFFVNTKGQSLSAHARHEEGYGWQLIESEHYSIYQDSSGGLNWKSLNHVNADYEVPVVFQGYKCFENDTNTGGGMRANPLIRISSNSVNLTAYIAEFWQNFPKAVEVKRSKIELKLFPDRSSTAFELQGGEQKNHTFYLDFGRNSEALNWCKSTRYIQIDSNYYSNTKTIHLLQGVYCEDKIQKLINEGIFGEYNFFAKREVIDEFGWRNFGDIYADHEELEYRESIPLISHYNNQYDALDGFLRQYVVSGDRRWFDLAGPLARHIIDIDIYNTTKDRDEYNGGLFWHTDHYSNAFTSTHRTYSAKNSTSRDGEVGGGPGPEHCYTTGLTNFYFLVGDPVYKQAALKLVQWIDRSFKGTGTLLERIQKFVTKDLSIVKKLILGRTVQYYKFPFTRATGNYISALLDGYQLTGDSDYIGRVEAVISQSVHPKDDIALRHLEDIEKNWSYLVFLQAICKYLVIKSADGITDNAFYYAKDSLLHYANWILDNERPFLESSWNLEFPNLTWAAQDLRKAYILQVASCFNVNNKGKLLSKTEAYKNYLSNQLKNGENCHHTRILVILMQNYLPDDCVVKDSTDNEIELSSQIEYGQAPRYKLRIVLLDFVADVLKCFCRFSLSSEIRWLKFRIKSF